MGRTTTDRKPFSVWLLSAMVLILLLAFYVGAYLAVTSRFEALSDESDGVLAIFYLPVYSSHPEVDAWLNWAFQPLHAVDRKIRPQLWDYFVDLDAQSKVR